MLAALDLAGLLAQLGLLVLVLFAPTLKQLRRAFLTVDPISMDYRRSPTLAALYGLLVTAPTALFVLQELHDLGKLQVLPFLSRYLRVAGFVAVPIMLTLLRPMAALPLDRFDVMLLVSLVAPVALHEALPRADILYSVTFPEEPLLRGFDALYLTLALLVTLLFGVLRPQPDTGLGPETRLPRARDALLVFLGCCVVAGVLAVGAAAGWVGLPAGGAASDPAHRLAPWEQALAVLVAYVALAVPLEIFFRGVVQNIVHARIEARRDIARFTSISPVVLTPISLSPMHRPATGSVSGSAFGALTYGGFGGKATVAPLGRARGDAGGPYGAASGLYSGGDRDRDIDNGRVIRDENGDAVFSSDADETEYENDDDDDARAQAARAARQAARARQGDSRARAAEAKAKAAEDRRRMKLRKKLLRQKRRKQRKQQHKYGAFGDDEDEDEDEDEDDGSGSGSGSDAGSDVEAGGSSLDALSSPSKRSGKAKTQSETQTQTQTQPEITETQPSEVPASAGAGFFGSSLFSFLSPKSSAAAKPAAANGDGNELKSPLLGDSDSGSGSSAGLSNASLPPLDGLANTGSGAGAGGYQPPPLPLPQPQSGADSAAADTANAHVRRSYYSEMAAPTPSAAPATAKSAAEALFDLGAATPEMAPISHLSASARAQSLFLHSYSAADAASLSALTARGSVGGGGGDAVRLKPLSRVSSPAPSSIGQGAGYGSVNGDGGAGAVVVHSPHAVTTAIAPSSALVLNSNDALAAAAARAGADAASGINARVAAASAASGGGATFLDLTAAALGPGAASQAALGALPPHASRARDIESPRWAGWEEKTRAEARRRGGLWARWRCARWLLLPRAADVAALALGAALYALALLYPVAAAVVDPAPEGQPARGPGDLAGGVWLALWAALWVQGLACGWVWRLTCQVWCSAVVSLAFLYTALHLVEVKI